MRVATTAPPLAVPVPEDPGVRLVVSRRAPGPGGGGNVALRPPGDPSGAPAERAVLAAAAGLAGADVVWPEQVHGAGVARVGHADRGLGATDHRTCVAGVDALITAEVGVGLAVLAADCVPLVLVDPHHAVAAVHAGRRGLAAGVVPAALAGLSARRPERVVAVLGPAICGRCYEVPLALQDEVAAVVPEARTTTRAGTPGLDLRAGVAAQLRSGGVTAVRTTGGCTRCGGGPWFSARAAAEDRELPHGRHAVLVTRAGEGAGVEPLPSLQW